MRIVVAHNRYREAGGEDVVFRNEVALLRAYGHEVVTLEKDNRDLPDGAGAALALSAVWNRDSARQVRGLVRDHRAEVVHFHNILPQISPAAYYAARAAGAAVVQTLHNYRLLCVNAAFFRDGRPCEDCLGAGPWRGVWHRCYRGSVAASGAVAAMLAVHRARGTWASQVDRYIALTGFAKRKFVDGGLPASLISVKPNFVESPPEPDPAGPRSGFLFAGRLSAGKGLDTLLRAAEAADVAVTVAGEGGDRPATAAANVVWAGGLAPAAVHDLMRASLALVLPSVSYEGFPMAVVEAMANGLPVIASRIGGIPEIVEDGVTGLLVAPGDADDLCRKMRWAAAHPEEMARMGANARRTCREKYSPEPNFRMLTAIYQDAIRTREETR